MYGDERTDDELMRAIQKHDRTAFDTLLNRHKASLLSVIKYKLINQNLVDDAFNETMLRVWTSAKNFRFESSVKTWIITLAYGNCIDVLRKEISRTKNNMSDERLEYESSDSGDFDERSVTVMTVREALNKIPDEQRIPLEMVSWGMSEKEISETLDIPPGTVKSRCARGRASLKLLLQEFDPKLGNQIRTEADKEDRR